MYWVWGFRGLGFWAYLAERMLGSGCRIVGFGSRVRVFRVFMVFRVFRVFRV